MGCAVLASVRSRHPSRAGRTNVTNRTLFWLGRLVLWCVSVTRRGEVAGVTEDQVLGAVRHSRSALHVRTSTLDSTKTAAGHLPSRLRYAQVGAVAVSDVTFRATSTVECDDVGSRYYVHLPLSGRLESRHRGVDLTATPGIAAVYRPEGGSFLGRWTAGCRALCVELDRASVDSALAKLLDDEPSRATFGLAMNTAHGFARTWVSLLFSLSGQMTAAGSLLSHPLVAAPLAESVVNGFLLATTHSYSEALAVRTAPARPVMVRAAIDLMEADPQAPITVSMLAERCGVSVRGLQHGFARHVGMSPLAYLRDVRLRRAHEDLRTADPVADTVASIAQRWGFGHLSRFAAAHEAKYGQTPLRTLRATR
jgi:AraC-like DNA-binding protein